MKQLVKSLSIAAISLTLFACKDTNEKQESVIRVKTVKSVGYEEASQHEFPFISKPYRSSELSFRVGGPVNVMDIHSGKYYRKGDVIAAIDPRDYEIKLDRAKAIYNQAEGEYKRVESLFRLNNISASACEKAKADYESALAAYNSAKNDLSDTKLTAPFDGYVQEVMFEQYQDVKPSQPICSFIDINRIKIEFFVPQQVALSLKKEQPAPVRFDTTPSECDTAIVEQISKGTAKNNLSFLITAIIPNGDKELLAGMSGKVFIDNEAPDGKTVALPQHIIRNNPTKGSYVWQIENGTAKSQPVKTGKLLNGGMIEITSGLDTDEAVVSTCIELLSEGIAVKTIAE